MSHEETQKTGSAVLELLPENYQLNLSDFALFLSVMKNKRAYEDVLSIILDEEDLVLKEVKAEQVVLNQSGKRAIRLDAWAVDLKSCQFNTEMQNDTEHDDVRKRARENPEIMVRDKRILELDSIVTEVKQSEEWEAVKMNILEIGLEKGREEGHCKGREEGIRQGTQLGTIMTLTALVKDGLISIEEAAKRAQMTVEEFEQKMR